MRAFEKAKRSLFKILRFKQIGLKWPRGRTQDPIDMRNFQNQEDDMRDKVEFKEIDHYDR